MMSTQPAFPASSSTPSPSCDAAASSSCSSPCSPTPLSRRRPSQTRCDTLPSFCSLQISSPSVSPFASPEKPSLGGSLAMPQPRKALVSPKILFSNLDPVSSLDEPRQEHEALSELWEILRHSSQSGWIGAESPRAYDSPQEDRDEEEFELLEGGSMDVPRLSHSPAAFRSFTSQSYTRAKSVEPFTQMDFDFGTPPSRAPNPLALSCHFASLEQGAELDLFRPSPPIYDRREQLSWK